MTARVLVVDDIQANVRLLEARLAAEYFQVLTASSGQQALDICARERVDVVLLDVMMPGMDGFEVCSRLKDMPATSYLPVVMVTALDQPSDRLHGLKAGADDFLSKPVDDIALVTRVRNLARLKMLSDEMLLRASTSQQLGIGIGAGPVGKALRGEGGRILLIDDNPRSAVRILDGLAKSHDAFLERNAQTALAKLSQHNFDVLIVSLDLAHADGLRVCSQVRSLDRTRHLPIVVLLEQNDKARLLRALDLGVNDYLIRPVDRLEMMVRVKTQIKRKRHMDVLRNQLEESVEQAITDALTGLHNRRYLERHLGTLLQQAMMTGRPLSLLLADIDHFKRINDTYGHDTGDAVLKEFASRFRRYTRSLDLACRYGGEEFVIVMPGTELRHACQVGERLRACIAGEAFNVAGGANIPVTASVGLATLESAKETPETIFKRADNALYAAKREGRNRVVALAA
jgi:two-component system cell cycle response regulator